LVSGSPKARDSCDRHEDENSIIGAPGKHGVIEVGNVWIVDVSGMNEGLGTGLGLEYREEETEFLGEVGEERPGYYLRDEFTTVGFTVVAK